MNEMRKDRTKWSLVHIPAIIMRMKSIHTVSLANGSVNLGPHHRIVPSSESLQMIECWDTYMLSSVRKAIPVSISFWSKLMPHHSVISTEHATSKGGLTKIFLRGISSFPAHVLVHVCPYTVEVCISFLDGQTRHECSGKKPPRESHRG